MQDEEYHSMGARSPKPDGKYRLPVAELMYRAQPEREGPHAEERPEDQLDVFHCPTRRLAQEES